MRVIDRMEPHRRGLAMGAFGYFSAHGRSDLNIAIRTIVCGAGRVRLALGAGIMADSIRRAELCGDPGQGPGAVRRPRRCSREAAAVRPASASCRRRAVFSKPCWCTPANRCGGTSGALVAGCAWHGFPPPRSSAAARGKQAALLRNAGRNPGVLRFAAWLDRDAVRWRCEALPPRPNMGKAALRVGLGGSLTRGYRPFHKHLARAAWREALHEAQAAGWDEVVLADGAGRLVETATANLFFVRDGILRTPALADSRCPGSCAPRCWRWRDGRVGRWRKGSAAGVAGGGDGDLADRFPHRPARCRWSGHGRWIPPSIAEAVVRRRGGRSTAGILWL
jgi:hypothetical protein